VEASVHSLGNVSRVATKRRESVLGNGSLAKLLDCRSVNGGGFRRGRECHSNPRRPGKVELRIAAAPIVVAGAVRGAQACSALLRAWK